MGTSSRLASSFGDRRLDGKWSAADGLGGGAPEIVDVYDADDADAGAAVGFFRALLRGLAVTPGGGGLKPPLLRGLAGAGASETLNDERRAAFDGAAASALCGTPLR